MLWLTVKRLIVVFVFLTCTIAAAARFGKVSDARQISEPVDGAPMRLNTDGRMGLSATPEPKTDAPSAPAATFVVDRTDDTNAAAAQVCSGAGTDCSLRGAITKANSTAGADTITFDPATNGVPFTLTLTNAGGANEDANATGDLDIIGNVGITIIGNGASNTIIQGGTNATNGIDKVFAFNPICNVSQANSVSGVTIRFGRNTQPFGAGDFSFTGGGLDVCSTGEVGSSFSISNSIVTQNTNTDGYGGGMNIDEAFPSAGVITITNTQFTNNTTKYWGGGLNIFGDNGNATISGSTFSNNSTLGTGGVGAQGGGINIRITNQIDGGASNPTPFVNIDNSTVANNQAVGFGGGIDVAGAGNQNVNISNTSITGNSLIVTAGGVTNTTGGGIEHNNDPARTTTLTNVLIANNTSIGSATSHGGGIAHGSGTMIVRNTTISGNSTRQDGGGIYMTIGPSMTLTNSTISNNRADSDNNGTGSGGCINKLAGAGVVTLENAICGGNFKGTGVVADEVNGAITANFSLIANTTGATITGANNQTNVSGRLAALANNGGQTVGPTGFTAVLQTHALNSGSPALDNGSNALVPGPLTTDQRGTGFTRILDAADANTTDTVDIGAYEAHPSVEDLTDQTINQPSTLGTSFNVGDANFTSGIDTITVTSSNTTLVPNANINLGGSGTNSVSNSTNNVQTLVITPAANQIGTTTITITATDLVNGTTQTMTDTFVLTVTAPDLTATKTNNVANAAVVGQTWTWTIAVTNGGNGAANFPTSSTIVSDNLPNSANISYGSPTPSIAGVSCSINGTKDLTCTATSPVTLAALGGNFNVQFTAVASPPGTAVGTYANPRGGGTASVDPGTAVAESNEGNNTFSNSVVVSKVSTTMGVTSSQNPSQTGQSVTFTATIAVTAPGAGTTTGTVQFLDGVNPITGCTSVTVAAGQAQCVTSSLVVGNHTITAAYSGDGNFNTSNGSMVGNPQVVNKANTTASIVSHTPDPSNVGQSVAVGYSVAVTAPGGGTPGGDVQISDGVNSCTGTVAAGSCSISLATAGSRTLTATYLGDSNYAASPASTGVSHLVGTVTWTGTTSTNYATGSNWNTGLAPGSGDNVIIPAGATNQPSITTASFSATTLTVASGRTLTVTAPQTLTVTGLLTNNGTIGGTGTIANNFSNGGTIAPGLSPGVLNVTGTFANTGNLNIEIGGAAGPGIDPNGHDQLAVSGAGTLGGTLTVTLTNGYTPAIGQSFVVFDAASSTGTFGAVFLPNISPNTWSFQYNNVAGTVTLLVNGPTAAGVSVSGRLLTAEGRGVRGAVVVITDSNGVSRTATPSALGMYRFDDVESGQTYVITVRSRRFTFTPKVVPVSDNLFDIDFVADN